MIYYILSCGLLKKNGLDEGSHERGVPKQVEARGERHHGQKDLRGSRD